MKRVKLKGIIVVALSVVLSAGIFMGCGEKKEAAGGNETAASEEKNDDEKESKDNTETEEVESVKAGEITKKALPGFENVFKSDAQKEFKLEFAKEGLIALDQVYAAMPSELQKEYFDSEKVFEQEAINKEGTSKIFNFQSSLGRDGFSADKNIGAAYGDISFNDQKEILGCTYEVKAEFITGKDKTIKLNEDGIKLAKAVLGNEFKDINIQEKFDEAYKTEETIVLKEDKHEAVKIRPSIYDSGNSITVFREKRVDYPTN